MAAPIVVFRADASTAIGTGHVVRCLALADALRGHGASCHFICSEARGHLLGLIADRGHEAHGLVKHEARDELTDWRADVQQCCALLEQIHPEWVVVDHYQLGAAWEREIAECVDKLLAIDDVGRLHQCDLLLDQNFPNPLHLRYGRSREGGPSQLLLGPEFALLGQQFPTFRARALARRDGSLTRLLITLGGSDPENETCKVLAGLRLCWQAQWRVDVVVGSSNPHRKAVEKACRSLPNTSLHVQTTKMAELMAAADCAITAAGSTTWERCCLGLPALVAVISSDQFAIATAVASAGAQVLVGRGADLVAETYANAIGALSPQQLRAMAVAAGRICDGLGAGRVAERMLAGVCI
jgi:UDP-2,4-diacetamido-2,4,6-trideoxy-beta-L-altropyranose hydrolase